MTDSQGKQARESFNKNLLADYHAARLSTNDLFINHTRLFQIKMNVIDVFSCPILVGIIGDNLSELRQIPPPVSGIKQDRVLEDYPNSKAILTSYFNSFMKLHFKYEHEFVITTSWINILKKGESKRSHYHNNCFWTGIFYYGEDYDKGSGSLILSNPLAEKSGIAVAEPNGVRNPLTNDAILHPEPNLLTFFPSYIRHGVQPVVSDHARYSLAFNFMPVGEFGYSDGVINPQWLQKANS